MRFEWAAQMCAHTHTQTHHTHNIYYQEKYMTSLLLEWVMSWIYLFIYLKESNVFYRFVFAITYYSNYPEQIEHIAFILKKGEKQELWKYNNAIWCKVYLNDLS